MELDIAKLREQRRPLWMSTLGIDNYADMIGGGGDIWQDRLSVDWARHTGTELSDEEAKDLGFESAEEGYESIPSSSSEASTSSSYQESSSSVKKEESSPGVGVGVGADVDVELRGVGDTVNEVTGAVSDTLSKTSKTLGNILGGATKKEKKSKE